MTQSDMKKKFDYTEKFERMAGQTLFPLLKNEQKNFIRSLAFGYQFTFQELRKVSEACRDLDMWAEQSLREWWPSKEIPTENGRREKIRILKELDAHMSSLKKQVKIYPREGLGKPPVRVKNKIVGQLTDKNIYGECPVQSPRTVCCNLKTFDAVQSCVFGCSYCTIQTFYEDKIVIEEELPEKLGRIKLDPQRYYHIGTGQSSDALAYGNRNGMLEALCDFARKNPNVMLEFKTKSDNILYFMENDIPPNIVCSWSLNPQIIIDNEEHFSASLQNRLEAARAVTDRGIKVAFHFHPIIYYSEWQTAYPQIAHTIMEMFEPREVLFISFGSVTFIKPVIKKIRKLGLPSKILQMEFVTDPHGKLTYPDAIKVEKFSVMYKAFLPWREKVFFYLCMEKASIWQDSLGFVYETNEEFEKDMLEKCFAKIDL